MSPKLVCVYIYIYIYIKSERGTTYLINYRDG